MAEPVKLSRERWEMLARGKSVGLHGDARSLVLGLPVEIDGITFLPAEYVPADAMVTWGRNGDPWLKNATPYIRA